MFNKLLSPELVIYTTVILILTLWFHWRWKYRSYLHLAKKLPGPPSYPLIGTTSMYTDTYDGKKLNFGSVIFIHQNYII